MVHNLLTTDSDDIAFAVNGTTLRTLEARFADVINVKDYGCVGDDSTDDTTNFQAAIDAAISAGKPLYVPAGIYILDSSAQSPSSSRGTSVAIEAVLTSGSFRMFGDGPNSVLKRKADATFSDNRYLCQIFINGNCDLVHISDLYIDSNASNIPLSGGEDPTDFEYQHCADFRPVAGPAASKLLRTLLVENCIHDDPVADNWLFSTAEPSNADYGIEHVIFRNHTCINRIRARSDITCTGATPLNLTVDGFNGFRVEYELGVGNFDEKRYININNYHGRGDVDGNSASPRTSLDIVGVSSTEQEEENLEVNINNCRAEFWAQFHHCVVRATNSVFNVIAAGEGAGNPGRFFLRPGKGTRFSNCKFLLGIALSGSPATGSVQGLEMSWPGSGNSYPYYIQFDGCHFEIDAPRDDVGAANVTGGFAFGIETTGFDDMTEIPTVEVSNCTFDERLYNLIQTYRNNKWILKNNTYRCQNFPFNYNSDSNKVLHLIVDGGNWDDAGTFMNFGNTFDSDNMLLELKNIFIDEDVADFTQNGSYTTGDARIYSNRVIYCDSAPSATATPGIRGDRRVLKAPAASQVNEWIAINTHHTGSDWVPVAAVGAVLT